MLVTNHIPATGDRLIRYCGDILRFELHTDGTSAGRAWLRTNLGQAAIRRREIIEHVEQDSPILSRDWNDIPMQEESPGKYILELPLDEIGRFEAKAFFMPHESHTPVWPGGDNTIIKVEPACTAAGNSVYTAFVRQFGPHKHLKNYPPSREQELTRLENDGYAVIPKSGTFRQLAKELDHIIGKMGFNIIQLLPIHPVPTTYARMGRFGSPFASIDFLDVDPALAEFDRKTTPLDQFCELTDAVHARNARLMIDLPINHTGWASYLQLHHPEWFVRDEERSFVSPGAWGVTWEDLSELDYSHRELWQYMAEVFLFWCRKGVDGFRCDAGYMVPLPVWEYITAKVREEYPDTIFLLEGLGGKISVTEALLDRANLNWAYSEMFQIYDRGGFEAYLPQAFAISKHYGTLINYAETHDNNRLAAVSPQYAMMRTALAALLSENGAFGITNGVEWFATAKVDVHRASPLNWGAAENQVEHIASLNSILNRHPAFSAGAQIRQVQTGGGNVLAVLRSAPNGEKLLIAINLDHNAAARVNWRKADFSPDSGKVYDLISGREIRLSVDGDTAGTDLAPLAAVCLAATPALPEITDDNRLYSSAALRLCRNLLTRRSADAPAIPHSPGEKLRRSPQDFCEEITAKPLVQNITCWNRSQDVRRCVMLPTDHTLLVKAPHPFRAAIAIEDVEKRTSNCESLPGQNGEHFAFLCPARDTAASLHATLLLTEYPADAEPQRLSAPLLLTGSGESQQLLRTLTRKQISDTENYALLTNNRGAYSQVRLEWGRIVSQYDCLLGANLDPEVPVDRQIMFTRCRAWLVHRDYSREVTPGCIRQVSVVGNSSLRWLFEIPVGMGKSITLEAVLRLVPETNLVKLVFTRIDCDSDECRLPTDDPVTLILRPHIEDRSFHTTTKAFAGAEQHWPAAVAPVANGFDFAPGGNHRLEMRLSGGRFTGEPEWYYNIPHPFEAQRGLADSGDLFSPGFFKAELKCDNPITLSAAVSSDHCLLNTERISVNDAFDLNLPDREPLADALRDSIRAFIVKRNDTRTVIAGYPWFLDWGRDTLICLRGIIAAGMLDEARDILVQFARFEKNGTLPNMIRGNDDSNRDTTDAPLWFFTACSDYQKASPDSGFLTTDCGSRTLRDVLKSLAENYIKGTPNGIYMDAESALIFSPSHYTWMDTNFPAGTPREGYPIEIQALWFAALRFMAEIDDDKPRWQNLAQKVKESIAALYTLPDRDYMADCLLASSGTPAKDAVQDNALRPNQLFAITLGAIDDERTAMRILAAAESLLIPGAIRSLADRPVSPPLPVYRDGVLLNDPQNPYWGYYGDDEDTRRKPAYHNGTAWSWPFPSYCEALYMIGGEDLRPTALSILSSGELLANSGCIGHIPEILDGNHPHAQRGCQAQAWGDTELYRILRLLQQ